MAAAIALTGKPLPPECEISRVRAVRSPWAARWWMLMHQLFSGCTYMQHAHQQVFGTRRPDLAWHFRPYRSSPKPLICQADEWLLQQLPCEREGRHVQPLQWERGGGLAAFAVAPGGSTPTVPLGAGRCWLNPPDHSTCMRRIQDGTA
jgi:hypothetical protein